MTFCIYRRTYDKKKKFFFEANITLSNFALIIQREIAVFPSFDPESQSAVIKVKFLKPFECNYPMLIWKHKKELTL